MNVVISVGNTDNKLSQAEWHDFTFELNVEINQTSAKVHFFGGPPNWFKWQNVAWILEVDAEDVVYLQKRTRQVREKFGQTSVFFMIGDGQLI